MKPKPSWGIICITKPPHEGTVSPSLRLETLKILYNYPLTSSSLRYADEIIDLLLDQPDFECDPINRLERDTPLHSVIRWLNSEPPEQRAFGQALVEMMLEAGSNPRVKNKAGLTATQLVDPRNTELRDLIEKHEYANQNAGDFVNVEQPKISVKGNQSQQHTAAEEYDDDDAEFSGSDEEERAEWEKRRKDKRRNA